MLKQASFFFLRIYVVDLDGVKITLKNSFNVSNTDTYLDI